MGAIHGPRHHDKHRRALKGLLAFWLTQVVMWTLLLVGAFAVPSLRLLFERVYWVSILSLYANLTTVVSIVAGLWATLTAGNAHEDSEHTRHLLTADMLEINGDLRRLADLHPGVEAHQLARRIGERLKGQP